MPTYAKLVNRTSNEGTDAWEILFQAWQDRAAGREVFIMAVGDPDFNTPQPIIDAATRALNQGHTHYIHIPGLPELREQVARELMRVSGFGKDEYTLTGDNVMIMTGTQNAIFAASLLLLEEGDEAIALEPMYVTYQATWEVNGARLVRVAMPRENGFRPVPSAIEAAVTPRTRAIILTNPNNPTGVVMTREELQAIADIAIRHDLWVISDEVYATQTFERPHVSIAALPGMKERTVTTGSLSKSQAMTGWRIGWIAGPAELIDHCHNLGIAMHYGVPSFIQHAAMEALTHSLGEIDRMLAMYRQRCKVVVDALSGSNKIRVLEPEGGMYILLDVTGTGLTSREFARRLYDATGVALLDARPFGESADGCVRIAFTISEEALSEGSRRIREFAETL